MLTTDPYSYDGDAFSMPERSVLPRPFTQPHPPLWLACGSPSTFEKAGRLGMGALCFTMGEPEDLAPLIETYRNAIAACDEPMGEYVERERRLREHAAVPRGPRAGDRAVPLEQRHRTTSRSWCAGSTRSRCRSRSTARRSPCPSRRTRSSARRWSPGRRSLGAPEDVAKSVERWQGAGADQVIFGMLDNTLPVEIAQESIEIFGRDVIPAFDTDPVHSTTRQREQQIGARG